MRFSLVPRSRTLDDHELLEFEFLNFEFEFSESLNFLGISRNFADLGGNNG